MTPLSHLQHGDDNSALMACHRSQVWEKCCVCLQVYLGLWTCSVLVPNVVLGSHRPSALSVSWSLTQALWFSLTTLKGSGCTDWSYFGKPSSLCLRLHLSQILLFLYFIICIFLRTFFLYNPFLVSFIFPFKMYNRSIFILYIQWTFMFN